MTWLPPSLMSGQEIYDNFQQGPGAEGISSSAAMVNQLAGQHQARVDQLIEVRSLMEAAWQGEAAGAAQRGLGPLVTEHDKSGNALHTAQDLTGRQAGSFGDAKNKVVPVPPAPGEVDPLVVLTNPGVAVTHYQQVSEHNQAAQHNVDVMNNYTGASRYNTDRQPSTFGELADDQAGVTVDAPDTIEVDDSSESTSDGEPSSDGESTSDSEPRGSVSWPGSGDPGYRPPVGGEPGPGTGSATTTPEGHTTPPAGPGAMPPGADFGPGQSRPAPGGGIVPGVGIGMPVDGRGPGGSGGFRGGAVGGAPRGGGLGGGLRGGPGVGAGQFGAAGRSAAAMATGPGRGGAGFGGLPVGAGGRGRGAEDTERKAPAYLEGGDPEELFDTDQLTAPPAIGEEEDD